MKCLLTGILILVLILGAGVVNAYDITLNIENIDNVTRQLKFNETMYCFDGNSAQDFTFRGVNPNIEELNNVYLYARDGAAPSRPAPLFRFNHRTNQMEQFIHYGFSFGECVTCFA
ncbi:MAG: hypothetical protein LBR15_00505 [Methanobrevibacter sp.]|jgi:hypothetical protein|nr:hypothetical protein [Candidatus Methanovirga australis]